MSKLTARHFYFDPNAENALPAADMLDAIAAVFGIDRPMVKRGSDYIPRVSVATDERGTNRIHVFGPGFVIKNRQGETLKTGLSWSFSVVCGAVSNTVSGHNLPPYVLSGLRALMPGAVEYTYTGQGWDAAGDYTDRATVSVFTLSGPEGARVVASGYCGVMIIDDLTQAYPAAA